MQQSDASGGPGGCLQLRASGPPVRISEIATGSGNVKTRLRAKTALGPKEEPEAKHAKRSGRPGTVAL